MLKDAAVLAAAPYIVWCYVDAFQSCLRGVLNARVILFKSQHTRTNALTHACAVLKFVDNQVEKWFARALKARF